MKEFDLEKAKAGAQVCTRNGREARIVCFDAKGITPIVALVTTKTGSDRVLRYRKDGRYRYDDDDSIYDLITAQTEKKTGWVNIYKTSYGKVSATSRVYPNKIIAEENKCSGCIGTCEIEWEE